MPIELPPLPYDLGELEPHVSRDTLEIHHGRHHKAYVDKVNGLVADTSLADADLEEIIRAARRMGDQALLNQAGQAWNHDFLWKSMTPYFEPPSGQLAERLERDLGGLAGFRKAFKAEAVGHFASGWAWLCLKEDRLVVTSLHDGDTPLGEGLQPLLTCDLWEHAYYLDYQNQRAAYVDAFLDHLANWAFAARALERAEAEARG